MDRDIVNALVKAVEIKDQSTAAHTWRVALYTMALVEDMGVDREQIDCYVRGAVMHDVGKIDIPTSILTKTGPLTAQEFETVKRHPVLGYDRLVRMGETDEIVLGLVRWHHERIDGSGYPDGLVGDEIPAAARSFAVIDTFDALTSLRPYREFVGDEAAAAALRALHRRAGTWYCAEAVDRFTALYESGAVDWILSYFNDRKQLAMLSSLPDREALKTARERHGSEIEIETHVTGSYAPDRPASNV